MKREKPSAGAAGKWLIRDREMEMKMEFKVEGSKLEGTFEHSQLAGQVEFNDGKIEGDKISFSYVRRIDGQDLKISWTGMLSGDEIKFKREYSSGGTGSAEMDYLWGDMFESAGLTWNQMQKVDDAVQSDMRELGTKLQKAQKAAIKAALDKNAAEDDVREKIDAVIKVQLEIAMLRYDKGLKPIKEKISEGQKTQLKGNASWGFQQLFAGGPPGFESSLERSMASSFLKAIGIGKDVQVTQNKFEEGLARWFESRDQRHTGSLSEKQLGAGLNKAMNDMPMMMPFPDIMDWGPWRNVFARN